MTRIRNEGSLAGWLCWMALFMLVRIAGVQAFTIPSGSATPTLLTGDTIEVAKYAYGYDRHSLPFAPAFLHGRLALGSPRRGDMVVFANPYTGATTIKRVVGLPGDRIQVLQGRLLINGIACQRVPAGTYVERDWDDAAAQPVEVRRYRYQETLPNGVVHDILGSPADQAEDNGIADNTGLYVVPAGHYFGMGDSRDNSIDSRFLDQLGYIPADDLIGQARWRLMSMQPGAHLWQFWKWPTAFRFERFLGTVV